MNRSCFLCHRNSLQSQSRSHSNIATKVRQYVNLQRKAIRGKRQWICTRCIRSMEKSASN